MRGTLLVTLARHVAVARTFVGRDMKHYKGGLYHVVAAGWVRGRWGETAVIYNDADGNTWARPAPMFNEHVPCGNGFAPRFTLVTPDEQHEADRERRINDWIHTYYPLPSNLLTLDAAHVARSIGRDVDHSIDGTVCITAVARHTEAEDQELIVYTPHGGIACAQRLVDFAASTGPTSSSRLVA